VTPRSTFYSHDLELRSLDPRHARMPQVYQIWRTLVSVIIPVLTHSAEGHNNKTQSNGAGVIPSIHSEMRRVSAVEKKTMSALAIHVYHTMAPALPRFVTWPLRLTTIAQIWSGAVLLTDKS